MVEYGIIRHGYKLDVGEERKPLEKSGLTQEQQVKWKKAVNFLKLEEDPGITYESLPLIEKLAEDLYEKLPSKATIIFTSTAYPRTKMTAELLTSELIDILNHKQDKDIGVSFLWEPPEEANTPESMSNILNIDQEAKRVQKLMQIVSDQDKTDKEFEEYLKSKDVNKTFSDENEKLREVVNTDLARKDSVYKERAKLLKKQLRKINDTFSNDDRPVYFYGIGHHPNLITLDVAFNNRDRYDLSDQVPEPLTLWEVDKDKVEKFLEN